jgi:hypothetical protein
MPAFEWSWLEGVDADNNDITRILTSNDTVMEKLELLRPVVHNLRTVNPDVVENCFWDNWNTGTMEEQILCAILLNAKLYSNEWNQMMRYLEAVVADDSYKLVKSSLKREPVTIEERIYFSKNISRFYHILFWIPEVLDEMYLSHGLEDPEIPIEVRIMKIANIYDRRMTSTHHGTAMVNAIVEEFSSLSYYRKFKDIAKKMTLTSAHSQAPTAETRTKIAIYDDMIHRLATLSQK